MTFPPIAKKYEKISSMWPLDRDVLERYAADEIKYNDDTLVNHDGGYDSYYGSLEIMHFQRPDGSEYEVTIGVDPVQECVFRTQEDVK
jgi:hypothetical protein